MEHRDELLDLVNSYINNRNVSPSLFSNLFSSHNNNNNNNRTRQTPYHPRNQQPDTERLLLIFNELLMTYNNNISRYQENMESLISIFRRFVPTQTHNPRTTRRATTETPPTFFYSWVPQTQPTFENVIVSPSDEEIERATTNFQYNPETPPINTRCPITLDNFLEGDEITVITHCGHAFKSTAFTGWFRTNVRCPVCRYDIREYRGSGENSIPDNIPQTYNESSDASNNTPVSPPRSPINRQTRQLPPLSSPREGVAQNDITSVVQRLISESITASLQDITNQTPNENATFMFDFNFPYIARDASNNT